MKKTLMKQGSGGELYQRRRQSEVEHRKRMELLHQGSNTSQDGTGDGDDDEEEEGADGEL